MIVLDENFEQVQRDHLRQWRIRTRKIGDDIGRKGLPDHEIVELLRRGRRVTFFSRDRDYYRSGWCHPRYCLVFLGVPEGGEALYEHRLLQHPRFDAEAKRRGHVIRVNPTVLTFWRLHAEREEQANWP